MNNSEIEQKIREYFPQIIHLSLATVSGTKPWVCEVHFSYDDNLNLYFMSSTDSRHAKELIAHPYVAGNIVVQHHKDQKVRCVDFEGTAEVLSGVDEDHEAYRAHAARYGASEGLLNELKKDGNARMFKVTVQDYYMFDSYDGPRIKHHLPWNGAEAQ